MAWPEQCAAVIPCLNEGESIAHVVAELRGRVARVFVVDDGSTDTTAAEARKTGATVISHPTNLGKGAALHTGLLAARKEGFAWAFTLDGDGQHKPADTAVFLEKAECTRAPLVAGNRMHEAGKIPWLRRVANRWMSRRLSLRAGLPLPDSQCGYRLIHLPAWAELNLTTQHFETESETLLAFVAAGFRVEFVPIQVVGRGPHSHIRPLLDTWRWFRWWRSMHPAARSHRPGLTSVSSAKQAS